MKSQLFCPDILIEMRYKSINNKELRFRHNVNSDKIFSNPYLPGFGCQVIHCTEKTFRFAAHKSEWDAR